MRNSGIEHDFLLRLIGRRDPADDVLLQRNVQQLDWLRLFAIAPNDLYAYLGQRLTEFGLDGQCPMTLFEQTRNSRRATMAQWLRCGLELRQLAQAFARHDVNFRLLKGAVLAFNGYPDHSLRSMADIDLLVRPEDLERAVDLVHAAGFVCPDRVRYRSPFVDDGLPNRRVLSLPMQKPGTRSLIEMHTQLESTEPWFAVRPELMWEKCEETFVNGLRIKTLEKHEFLFHLVLHLSRHHLFDCGLRALLDIHLWVELHRDRLDWEWLASEAARRGYAGWVHLTLKMSSDLLKTPIPHSFFRRLPPLPQFERLQQLGYELIWAERKANYQIEFLVRVLAETNAKKAITLLSRRFLPYASRLDSVTIPRVETLRSSGLSLGLQRAAMDLRIKVPKYFRAWRSGSFRWSSLKEATRLMKGRAELQQILANRASL